MPEVRPRLISRRFAAAAANHGSGRLPPQQRAFSDSFRRRIEGREIEMQPTECPCGATETEWLIAEVERYNLPLKSVMCGACGTIRFNPYLTESSLDWFYSSVYQDLYARADDLPSYFARQRAYGEKIWAHAAKDLPPQAAVLEIGCGAGGGLQVFQEHGCQVAGFDFAAPLVEYGASLGVRGLSAGNHSQLEHVLSERSWDFIYLHHVFEHVGDPNSLLVKIRQSLAAGGTALLIVPDIFQVGRFLNPAGDIGVFLHIAHKFNYSLRGLQRMAAQAGLTQVSRQRPVGMPTAWSTMPEIWLDLKPLTSAVSPAIDPTSADSLWRRLRRTETCYRLGLCSGQWKRRWGRLNFHLQRLLGIRKHGE